MSSAGGLSDDEDEPQVGVTKEQMYIKKINIQSILDGAMLGREIRHANSVLKSLDAVPAALLRQHLAVVAQPNITTVKLEFQPTTCAF